MSLKENSIDACNTLEYSGLLSQKCTFIEFIYDHVFFFQTDIIMIFFSILYKQLLQRQRAKTMHKLSFDISN